MRIALFVAFVALAPALAAQQPTAAQVQQALQQQPGLGDMVRGRISQSGLTADQIRSRLSASGYPSTLLDAYLSQSAGSTPLVPGSQELAALQPLVLPALTNPVLSTDTGLVRSARTAPSEVFGVDVFQRTTTQFLPLLAGPVPPDYKLGPGDNLVLILTGDVELAYSLPVTREGFVLIPQVGQVHVANLTLDQLRDVLYSRLGRVYSGVKRSASATTRFDVTVANVRANQVYVVGEVAQPGAYQISSLGTVFTALYAAGGVTERAKLRGVEVQRSGKTIATLDLYDYLLRGDTRADVRLETGDVVQVDSLAGASDQYTVAITGMVQQPGTYPWRPGITLRQLVVLARGPRIGADLRDAEIARLPADRSKGQLATTVRVPLDSSYLSERDSSRYIGPPGGSFPAAGTAPDAPLQPYDNVLIFRQPDFELQRTVTILGEVLYPGTYALKAKDDRLADLVQRAGGLTPRAYQEGIRFVRAVDNRGRININLPKALREHDSRDNVILQPGDSVRIPEYQPSVRVTGAVNSPGSVLYRKGAGLDYYLSGAGGFTRNAEKGQVSVRYANGETRTRRRSLLFSSNPSPGPGSEVYVPAKDPNAPHTDTVALFGAIAQILASTVAIIVIAKR